MIAMKPIFTLGGFAHSDRLIKIVKRAEIPQLTVSANVYMPYFISAMPRDACHAGCIVRFTTCVALVFSVADHAQINNAIIFWIAVYVVDLIIGPTPVIKRPRKSVVLIQLGVYLG